MCLNFIPSSIHFSIPAQPNLGARVSWIAEPSGFGLDGSKLRLNKDFSSSLILALGVWVVLGVRWLG